jgi:hypothetical protein
MRSELVRMTEHVGEEHEAMKHPATDNLPSPLIRDPGISGTKDFVEIPGEWTGVFKDNDVDARLSRWSQNVVSQL